MKPLRRSKYGELDPNDEGSLARMSLMTAVSSRKSRGGFYTPRGIASFIVKWAIRNSRDRILDPGAGEGIFLEEA